jgi:hypothetical protein
MDKPIVTVRQSADPKGNPVFLAELSVETHEAGVLLLVIDLSDSSTVTQADVVRIRRLLTPLPRNWKVAVTGLGTAVAEVASRYDALTVGDVVDGVLDLRALLFDAAVISRERSAGSFLSHTFERFFAAVKSADTRLVAVVVTDGKFVDVDPVRIADTMRVVGLAPEQGSADRLRWSEIVPGGPLIGRDTERDAIGRLRAAAGCAFHGPCVVTIPSGKYHIQAGEDDSGVDAGSVGEIRKTWDFSLRGRLVLKFRGSERPDHITVEGADGVQARLILPTPDQKAAAKAALGGKPEAFPALEVFGLSLALEELATLLRSARELAGARLAWQAPDGTLAIAPSDSVLASYLLDKTGRPQADAYLLLARELIGDTGSTESDNLLLMPLRHDSRIHYSPDTDTPPFASFTTGTAWSLHFNKLENRWMFTSADSSQSPLPPRGSQALPVDMRDATGASFQVFFSGVFRAP